ncbi:MAG: AAA family ATPase [Bacteroidales bacterium]|nr:AAA family ATPase [Bacteroidales bacterium]MCM1415886.1 AAA family ATPase [bacterium]MCM1422684.1 AAA family ATPase [bacterium]
MEEYRTSVQMAEQLGITKRQVNALCAAGKIEGAYKSGNRWMIPADAADGLQERTGARRRDFLPFPIGISDYKTAVSQYYYVDKTMLIKDLIDYAASISLFIRPRRFGKTLNMDMLRVFFEETDEDTAIYFKDTQIWECGEKYREEQGKYPVIYFSFKDIKYDTWEETRDNLYDTISQEFQRHAYLLEDARLGDSDVQYFKQVLQKELQDSLWAGTLKRLSQMLCRYHKTAPVILIDEYDTPIQQGHTKKYYDKVIGFMRNFLSGGLKDNPCVSRAFMTGILRVAKESIFSGLNNLSVNSVLDKRYSRYFGFTRNEVEQLLRDCGKPRKLKEAGEWYDGYLFGGTEIYNPWSILNYADNDCFPQTYWQSTGSNEILGDITEAASSEMLEEMRTLLAGQSVSAYIDTSVVYPDVRRNPASVYSFLLMAGYLTVKSGQLLYDGNSLCDVVIPNREIAIVYEKEILARLEDIIPMAASTAVLRGLLLGEDEKVQEALQNFLRETISYHDAASETFYHGLLLGMSAMLNQYYIVTSNRESGNGRYDIQLRPKDKERYAYLIEIKALDRKNGDGTAVDEALAALAETALRQIEEKGYEAELKQNGCMRIRKFGIAFWKKECRVKCEDARLTV